MSNRQILTLEEFTFQQYRKIPNATGELSSLLRDIGLAAKRINVEVNKAGLVDILGDVGIMNVQGENVKKLDVFANEKMIGALRHGISCAGVASYQTEPMGHFVANHEQHIKELSFLHWLCITIPDCSQP